MFHESVNNLSILVTVFSISNCTRELGVASIEYARAIEEETKSKTTIIEDLTENLKALRAPFQHTAKYHEKKFVPW